MNPAVCVFCSSSSQIDPGHLRLAEEVGAELARRSCSLVSGGAILSCMGAVARAARMAGARTVGVIPEVMVHVEIADHDNDELIITSDMRTRKAEMDRRADAFLVLPGGLGTLEELFEIWTTRSLGLHDKPLVVLDPDGFYDQLRAFVDQLVAKGFASTTMLDAVSWTTSVTEAFDMLQHAEGHDLAEV